MIGSDDSRKNAMTRLTGSPRASLEIVPRIWLLWITASIAVATYSLLYHLDTDRWPVSRQSQQTEARSRDDSIHNNGNNDHQDVSFITKFSSVDSDRVLNIHIVPHTHDDVGWRKTVEQYYTGANASIDTRGNVRYIISTAISSLLENPSRTFTYVEMKFFSMWWNEQPDAVKDSVRYLIASKQLGVANGGWCMHDEASSHYVGMIDQTSLGHAFLRQELGVVPTVGWQLDPFGHSAAQASLLTHAVGFDALYFGRIDYQDLKLRQLTRQCEGLWDSTASPPTLRSNTTSSSAIFWGLTGSYRGNYGAPDGFCFDVLCDDEPLLGANETRLVQRLQTFLQDVRIQSDRTVDNHVMLTMGTDFNYMEAHTNFANLDLLIGSIMELQRYGQLDVPALFGPKYDRVQVFYSSPEYYTQQKYKSYRQRQRPQPKQQAESEHPGGEVGESLSAAHSSTTSWQVKTDDFFPYSDCEHCFWTGYFTSRTSFKRMERVASSFLLAARQIDTLARAKKPDHSDDESCCSHPLFDLEDALGIAQHHDAVSGTGKQHVADDYSLKLHQGVTKAGRYLKGLLNDLLGANEVVNWTYCPLLHNESTCKISVDATQTNDTSIFALIYNPLPRNHSTIVRLPVASLANFNVQDLGDPSSPIQVIQSIPVMNVLGGGCSSGGSDYALLWDTGLLAPLGATTFHVSKLNDVAQSDNVSSLEASAKTHRTLSQSQDGMVQISNGLVTVFVDESTGQIKRMASDDMEIDLEPTWGYYTSFDANFDRSEAAPSDSLSQNSGAYIFRPSTPAQKLVVIPPLPGGLQFVNTSVGTEVHVSFQQPWIRQVTRIFTDQPFVEIEYTVGPIPSDDGRGKEVAARYSTPIKSDATFYTDSNGREFQRRLRNYRPSWNLDVYEPVAGNFYPVNAAMYLEDSDAAFAVVVDRSQAGSSLQDGALELMVQRRTLADDSRGVDEALNETCGGMTAYPPYGKAVRLGEGVIVRGTHRLLVGTGSTGAALSRSAMDAAFAEPLVFVATTPTPEQLVFQKSSFSGIQASLPESVLLVTFTLLQSRNETTVLLRLGHQYGWNEDDNLSSPVDVDVANLFTGFGVATVTEMTLTGNQELDVYLSRRMSWKESTPSTSLSGNTVTLNPMEIRTFEVVLSPH